MDLAFINVGNSGPVTVIAWKPSLGKCFCKLDGRHFPITCDVKFLVCALAFRSKVLDLSSSPKTSVLNRPVRPSLGEDGTDYGS